MLLRRLLLVLVALAVTGGAIFLLLTQPQRVAAAALPLRSPDLANGEAMFNAGGCAGCHTPDAKADRTNLSGGRALATRFGTFYVPNISPHPTDGIGAWTEEQFVTALLAGTAPDGRHYYPAFPYPSYARMRVADVRDLFAYVKTLPPIAGRARAHEVAFPFSIRRGIGLWKLLYLDRQTFQPDPAHDAQWNRGAYLVNGPGHCAECHSPRNVFGAVITRLRFAGGHNPTGQGSIPNITQDKLGNWSVDDFTNLLETGETPNFDSVSGDMSEVVKNTSRLSAADRTAMATYLKTLRPGAGDRAGGGP